MTFNEPGSFEQSAPEAPAEVVASAANPVPESFTHVPKPSIAPFILATVGIVVLLFVMALVVVYLIAGLGAPAFAFAGVLALIPLLIVVFGIRWIDRWDPEPKGALVFAFLWGAGMSVVIALLVGAGVESFVEARGGPGPGYEFFGAAIQAPIVEEVGKGFGVLLLVWFARRNFNGPVDGMVYAASSAAGFAFTENILYFGSAIIEPTGEVLQIFFIRGLLSPFAHVMFTLSVGILLGLAAHRTGFFGTIGAFLIGLIPAMLLHALWNGALFFVTDFYAYYAVVQVPLFVLAILVVVYLRRKEAVITRARLAEYAQAGWFNPTEVDALATPAGRRVAMAWAKQRGVGSRMKKYMHDSARLAFARQRMMTGKRVTQSQQDEARLLASIVATRRALQG